MNQTYEAHRIPVAWMVLKTIFTKGCSSENKLCVKHQIVYQCLRNQLITAFLCDGCDYK